MQISQSKNLSNKRLSRHLITVSLCLVLLIVFGTLGSIILSRSHAATAYVAAEPERGTVTTPAVLTTDSTASGGSSIKFVAPAVSLCGTSGASCTTAEIAAHNSQTNCWVIYSGSYYNITAYATLHPGGRAVFDSKTCGRDITAYMTGSAAATNGAQHGHSSSSYSDLNRYKIGPVK